MEVVQAAVAWVVSQDQTQILLVQNDDGLWSLPGGRIEDDEGAYAGVIRECYEETGLRVEIDRLLMVAEGFKTSRPAKVLYFHCLVRLIDPTAQPTIVRPKEILALKWVTLDEAAGILEYLPLPPRTVLGLSNAGVFQTQPRYP